MTRLTVSEPADCGLLFDIDIERYDDRWRAQYDMTQLRELGVKFLQSCPSLGFFFDGKPIGGVFYADQEAHMAVLPEYHGRWGLLHKQMMEWLFAIQEPMYTSVEISNEKCIKFMDRCQWRRVKTTDEYITFEARRRERPSRLG